jgi:hypothetical protein
VSVKNYLLNLTTKRAAHLFFVSLFLGGACIALGLGLPWTPAIVVFAYGSVLWYVEKAFRVSHTEMTNNSPYFLGFLFFLGALAKTFSSFSVQSGDSQLEYVVRQLGAGLFPTIVGLPFRQVLFAYSNTQADQDLFFRTLEDELRQSATEFRRSQAELVQLVQEFVQMRKGLFAEEEKAARKYVRNLENAIALFDASLSDYPAMISSTLSNCAQSMSGLKEKLRELTQAAEHMKPHQLSDMVAQFEGVKISAGGLAGELSALKGTMESLRTTAAGLPADIKVHLLSANADLDEVRADLRTKVANIQSDLSAIDKVLTDFVTVAQRHIEAIR